MRICKRHVFCSPFIIEGVMPLPGLFRGLFSHIGHSPGLQFQKYDPQIRATVFSLVGGITSSSTSLCYSMHWNGMILTS
ncbi:uncharacterized protein F5147DRAFT_21563 [Suillus discolor]|uniref:Uncharacterized protein n=1 Tax=Suillus discolor TaxID=1912936 RepID=A0A9P7FEW0_9AGAM|nr:uncharacterized protein F5147DRAFT_21563 [Suillus discolor]KAG2114279.1 hypothetical protein F5147DRAFT_21563 [Suillus discolor]